MICEHYNGVNSLRTYLPDSRVRISFKRIQIENSSEKCGRELRAVTFTGRRDGTRSRNFPFLVV